MKKILMVAVTMAVGMAFGAAQADFAAKCAVCHGADAKSGMAKKDLTAAAITLQACKDAVEKGKGTMPKATLAAPDTAESICKGAPLNKQ